MTLRQHAIWIGLLMLGAGALLGWLSAHAEILFADGLRYIRQAQAMDRGSWADGLLKSIDHPVFPLEIVAAHRLIGGDSPESWQAAAQGASVLAAVLLVVPMYLVARELFGDSAAWLACALAYALPVTSHIFADALSESTFLLFWTWGLWLALRFLGEGEIRWLVPAIGLAFLAYLTRPEGLLLPAALIATLGASAVVRPLRMSRQRWWGAFAVLVIGPACLIGPYVTVKGGLGTKPGIARVLGTAPRSSALAVNRQRPLDPHQTRAKAYAQAAKAVFEAVRDGVTIPLLGFALVGFAGHKGYGQRARAWLLLGAIGAASAVALGRLFETGGYCTPRHALIPVLLIFPAAAAGIDRTLAALGALIARHGSEAVNRALRPFALVVVLGGFVAAYAPRTLAPLNQGLGGYRAAGLWLRNHIPSDTRVVDLTGWSLFYGRLQGYTFANLIQAPDDPSVRWVVAREAHLHGPWGYCGQLRSLLGSAAPVVVFRGANPRHTVKVLVFDLQRNDSTPRLASPPRETIRR
jgi:4-amino-4-deoxy-L-arabinose transferase-like glycosyltransferase